MTMNRRVFLLTAFCASMLIGDVYSAQAPTKATAELKNGSGETIGTVRFTEQANGILVQLDAKKLHPGLHAVHIHAVGKCEGPDFKSAGGHFNPTKKKHGHASPEGAHAGDMPNMYVAADGSGSYVTLRDGVTLKAGETSLLDSDGSAIVIHVGVDDNSTDPTGNAGDRAACGVITRAP